MNYEDKATRYAEKHGIVMYAILGNTMMYSETFPREGRTIGVRVNLDTMAETRTVLKPDRPASDAGSIKASA